MIGYLATNHPLIRAFAPVRARGARGVAGAAPRHVRHAPRLADFLAADECLAVRGELERSISGLAIDRRRVAPGAVYFDLSGPPGTGRSGLDEAVSRGAVAVVTTARPGVVPARVTFVQVADARVALARAARRFYRFPDRAMEVVGVAGALGKTTVAHLLQHLLGAERRVGLLGSIHYELGQRTVPSFGSTPEALDLFGMMAQMRGAGCGHAVLELSAGGIEQQRMHGVQWAAAVVTNLETAGDEASAWQVCSGGLGEVPAVSVVNVGDRGGRDLVRRLAGESIPTRLVTFGEEPSALVRAENVRLGATGARFTLAWPEGAIELDSPLVGAGGVGNLVAAAAAAWGLGRDPRIVPARLRRFAGVPGRMERIDEGQPFQVWVDAAGTPGALRGALRMARGSAPGRLLVVFGCEGDRDRAPRREMTRWVQEAADWAVATADNPRTEGVARIFEDMRAGVTAPDRMAWIEDRRQAVGAALARARPGDAVLIAGRGQAAYQELADTVVPLDDRRIAREWLQQRER